MKKQSQLINRLSKGFTLVELLISMTILSMIMLLGSWSFSLFTTNWEGRLGHFSKNVSQTKDYILMNDIVSSIIPYVYRVSNNPRYYFKSTPTEMYAVTQSSIFHPKSAVAFKFTVEDFEDGSKYLLYQEAELGVITQGQEINYSHEKILIAKADDIQFKVFGWKDIQQKMASEDPMTNSGARPLWRDSYDAEKSNYMPLSIAIYWDKAEILIPMVNDQGSSLSRITQLENQ
ncbi:type II secretion system protein J [Shewanella sp. UCD-KL12]|uniref:PulJ/GspJ family protein n=1 Tax=Shewanella sp. UCD-KL12 TaxID=1917163 RepID=UPI0009705B96|nr:prepilin-type N-terminal cleavage/methylation domain-containing protein [Shewanella sp. UCD-KL12]